ncbi:hypothetical protein K435DRAFT_871157 [Dendrothele bispora CBS 962.96]|uniref:Uncharacterized protein n=1 Tax=Dendrothele bispora (strain CBS 962.96) TaxID=1314807 RepID=A0A4S8L663_DENBC|nr:hypothetical protein K435DRAFT_871157 [Dendrothele bispora CBS 962.96]
MDHSSGDFPAGLRRPTSWPSGFALTSSPVPSRANPAGVARNPLPVGSTMPTESTSFSRSRDSFDIPPHFSTVPPSTSVPGPFPSVPPSTPVPGQFPLDHRHTSSFTSSGLPPMDHTVRPVPRSSITSPVANLQPSLFVMPSRARPVPSHVPPRFTNRVNVQPPFTFPSPAHLSYPPPPPPPPVKPSVLPSADPYSNIPSVFPSVPPTLSISSNTSLPTVSHIPIL